MQCLGLGVVRITPLKFKMDTGYPKLQCVFFVFFKELPVAKSVHVRHQHIISSGVTTCSAKTPIKESTGITAGLRPHHLRRKYEHWRNTVTQ